MRNPLFAQRHIILVLLLFVGVAKMDAQMLSIRNNVLYDIAMTPNIGLEMVVGERKTIAANIMGNYKPWGKDIKMIFVQPEFRYYFSGRPMFKHFIGIGGIAGNYDIHWKGKVYDGVAIGGGITFGYVYKLNKRLNLDLHAGFGAILFKQKEYFEGDDYDNDYPTNGIARTNATGYSLLPTNIGMSLTYILK